MTIGYPGWFSIEVEFGNQFEKVCWLEFVAGLRTFPRLKRLPVVIAQHSSQAAELSRTLEEFAAVHAHDFTVDVAGAVAYQENREVGEFLDRSEAVHGV